MCLLWLLLQFIVLVMYWDVPPVSSQEEGRVVLEMKGEEPREEEAPLMGPDEEPSPSYEAVGGGQLGPGAPAASSPFRNFSASGGETFFRSYDSNMEKVERWLPVGTEVHVLVHTSRSLTQGPGFSLGFGLFSPVTPKNIFFQVLEFDFTKKSQLSSPKLITSCPKKPRIRRKGERSNMARILTVIKP